MEWCRQIRAALWVKYNRFIGELPAVEPEMAVCERSTPTPSYLTDADKLRLVADWFDVEQSSGRWEGKGKIVQDDLRRIADGIERFEK